VQENKRNRILETKITMNDRVVFRSSVPNKIVFVLMSPVLIFLFGFIYLPDFWDYCFDVNYGGHHAGN